jgi:hypothetical protein
VIFTDILHRFFMRILHAQKSLVAMLAAPTTVGVQFISEDLGQNSAEDYNRIHPRAVNFNPDNVFYRVRNLLTCMKM